MRIRAVPAAAASRSGGASAPQAELPGDRLHRRDDVRDVLVELELEQLRALVDLVAVHAGGEGRLLQLLAHRLRLEAFEAVRAHEPTSVDESGQLVAGKARLLERRVALDVQVLRV